MRTFYLQVYQMVSYKSFSLVKCKKHDFLRHVQAFIFCKCLTVKIMP